MKQDRTIERIQKRTGTVDARFLPRLIECRACGRAQCTTAVDATAP